MKTGRLTETQGKAAHSSTPHMGENAIIEMLRSLPDGPVGKISGGSSANTVPASASAVLSGEELVSEVYDLSSAVHRVLPLYEKWRALCLGLRPASDAEFSPAEVVTNLGRIESHGTTLSVLFDARLLPEHGTRELLTAFLAAATTGDGVRIGVIVERDNPGMRAPRDGLLLQALGRALSNNGLSPESRSKPTSTEAGVFFRNGVEAAVFGPGVSIGNAHTANEWNSTRQLEGAIQTYCDLVRELCVHHS